MKKNGFTMVELLVVIVIIGILSIIGIVTVTDLRENQRKKFDISQNEIFVQTAKTYFTDNKSRLPSTPFGTKIVTLKELK